jgi:hypothetical protein
MSFGNGGPDPAWPSPDYEQSPRIANAPVCFAASPQTKTTDTNMRTSAATTITITMPSKKLSAPRGLPKRPPL